MRETYGGRNPQADGPPDSLRKALAPPAEVSAEKSLTAKKTTSVAGNQVLSLVFVLTSVLFGMTLVAVTTTIADYNLPVLVRGSGMVQFSGAIVLLTPTLDRVSLMTFSTALLVLSWASVLPRFQTLRRVTPIFLTISAGTLVSLIAEGATPQTTLVPPVAAAGVALVGFGFIYGLEVFRVSPRRMLSYALVAAISALAALEAASSARWMLNGFDGVRPFSGGSWYLSLLELRLFDLTYWFLPRLTLLFFLAWVIRLVSGAYLVQLRRVLSSKLSVSGEFQSGDAPASLAGGGDRASVSRSPRLALLGLAVGLAAFVGLYAYLPAVNPTSILVGTDVTGYYQGALQRMLALPPPASIYFALSNDRAVYLLFQYGVAGITRSPDLAIRVMPAILAASLVLSTYYFLSVASKDRTLAAVAAVFAAFSFQVTVGVNGGFYANWLAVVESFVFFAAFLLGLQRRNRRYFVLSSALSVLVLYTHPWGWFAIIGVVAAYEGTAVLQARLQNGRIPRSEILFVVGLLAVNFAADQVRQFLPTGSGIASVYSSSLVNLSLSNFIQVVNTLGTTFQVFLGGAFANPPMIVLSIIGVLAIPTLQRSFGRLLICWLVVASVGILFSGYSAEFLQPRVLYLVPFQVFAAMGFLALVRFATGLVARRTTEGTVARVFTLLAYVASSAMFLSYALRTVGYLYA